MGTMSCLYEKEGEKIIWNPAIPVEVDAARARFEHYLSEGYIACKITQDGNRGVHIAEFDPEAEEIILIQLVDGG